MSRHLPLAVVLGVDLEGTDAEAVLTREVHVDKGREHGRLAVQFDLQIAEGERLVSCWPPGDGGEVLLLGLELAPGVSVLKVVGQKTLERGGVLLDRALCPRGGDNA